jgi:hypothetical protein
VAPASPSQVPSDPTYPTQVILSPRKVEQASNGEATQPLPLVTHPVYHSTQPSFVTTVMGAEVQTLALQLVPPGNPSQFPSLPFSPEQSTSVPGYPEQGPQVAVQPLPVE